MNKKKPDIEALIAKAEAGDVEAQYQMGASHIGKDDDEALHWFRQAAAGGHLKAQYMAAVLLECLRTYEGKRELLGLLRKASDKGHLESMRWLAEIYIDGWKDENESDGSYGGFPRDLKKAFKLYEKLCAQDDKGSYYQCGKMLLDGLGVPKNTEEGFGYILKAACFCPFGSDSLCTLSECYYKGIGVEANPVEAYIWSLMAMANEYSVESNPENNTRIAALETELSANHVIRKAQGEARRREKLREEGNLTPEYCLAKAARYGVAQPAPTPPTPSTPLPAEIFPDDPQATNILEYKFLSRIRSDKQPFDLGKVRLQIVTDGLQKVQRVDFSELVVSYGDKGQNRKQMSLFHKLKVCAQERRLLVKLAILAADKTSRERKLKSFIQSADPKQLSHLNAMFLALFGDFAEPASSMISRKDGTLKVNLGVDRLSLRQARDYQEFDL